MDSATISSRLRSMLIELRFVNRARELLLKDGAVMQLTTFSWRSGKGQWGRRLTQGYAAAQVGTVCAWISCTRHCVLLMLAKKHADSQQLV